eukprot:4856749-Prorocentrum_lima.AAC.1
MIWKAWSQSKDCQKGSKLEGVMERKGKDASQPQCGIAVMHQCCKRDRHLLRKGGVGMWMEVTGVSSEVPHACGSASMSSSQTVVLMCHSDK